MRPEANLPISSKPMNDAGRWRSRWSNTQRREAPARTPPPPIAPDRNVLWLARGTDQENSRSERGSRGERDGPGRFLALDELGPVFIERIRVGSANLCVRRTFAGPASPRQSAKMVF